MVARRSKVTIFVSKTTVDNFCHIETISVIPAFAETIPLSSETFVMTEQAAEQLDSASGEQGQDQELQNQEENQEQVENEIVLAGQEDSPSSGADKEPKDFILERMKRRRDKAVAESQAKDAEIARLQQQVGRQQSSQVPQMPTLATCGYDEERFAQAMAEWNQARDERLVQTIHQRQQSGMTAEAMQQAEQKALSTYAERAGQLGVSDFNQAQDAAMDVLGEDFGRMLARELPEDAPKLMYWFGKNPAEASNYREMFETQAGKTTFALGKLAGQLTVKRKQSSAANPEGRVDGEGSAADGSGLESQIAKVEKQMDDGKIGISDGIKRIRALKQEAAAAS